MSVRRIQRAVTGWLGNRSMRMKFTLSVGVMAAVACLLGLLGVVWIGSMHGSADALYNRGLVPVAQAKGLEADIYATRMDLLNRVISTDEASQNKYDQLTQADIQRVQTGLDQYERTATDRATVAELRTVWAEYLKRIEDLLAADRRDDHKEVERLRNEYTGVSGAKAQALAERLATVQAGAAKSRLDDATSVYSTARTLIIFALVVGIALALLFAALIARTAVTAIGKVSDVVDGLVSGDLTRSSDIATNDEIGQMAISLDAATDNLRSIVQRIGRNSDRLAGSSKELATASENITDDASRTAERSATVSAAAETVTTNVETVAASAEELSASIGEIASGASDAAKVAKEAVVMAESANATITKLSAASVEIGDVVNLITSIAEQTNLLALNATIEAARAGASGKGFAVVANEVKELAQQTATATQDISGRIEDVQAQASAAVEAIGQVARVINKIDEFSASIASAAEEQTATVSEVSRNVGEAATGTSEIARTITDVAEAARQTNIGAGQSHHAAEELARMASDMQQLVDQFEV